MSPTSRLPLVPAPDEPASDQKAAPKATKTRKATRGQTLARAQEVAATYVGDESPLDAAFAAFGRFDAPDGRDDAEAIAQAQAVVRALLHP